MGRKKWDKKSAGRDALRAAALLQLLGPAWARGGAVVGDGSFGHAGELPGPNYQVPAGLGRQAGANLFHSFSRLDLDGGESVTFTGPPSVHNVLARVTGGAASGIDGTLRCTIPDANFYLVNPAGVVFGPHAALDVKGSFAVTTAPVIRLSGGGSFNAVNPAASVLTSASPAAFGFLSPNPAAVTVRGTLAVPQGKVITLVAGPLTVAGGVTQAPAGRVNIVSAAAAGDVTGDASDAGATLDASAVKQFGPVTINAAASVDASGPGGGRIVIRAGSLAVADGASVTARTLGDANGLGISVTADAVSLTGGGFLSAGARVGTGNAGPIDVTASTLTMDGMTPSGVASGLFTLTRADSAGRAGDVTVRVDTLRAANGAQVDTNSFGTGGSGRIDIVAKDVTLDAGATGANTTGLFSFSQGNSGPNVRGGDVSVKTDTLRVLNSAGLVTDTRVGAATAGDIRVEGKTVLVGDGGVISADTTAGTGPGGVVRITTGRLSIRNGGQVSASTFAGGPAGGVEITADTLDINGAGAAGADGTGITAETDGPSTGGGIRIAAGTIRLQNRGEIRAPSFGGDSGDVSVRTTLLEVLSGSDIVTSTLSTGRGGAIDVSARVVRVRGNGQDENTAISTDGGGAGPGGSILLRTDTLSLAGAATVSANAGDVGHGGNIRVAARDVTVEGSSTTIQAGAQGAGAGGDVEVAASGRVRVINGGRIIVSTDGKGAGGNVTVAGGSVRVDGSAEDLILPIGRLTRLYSAIRAESNRGSPDDPNGVGPAGGILVSGKSLRVGRANEISASSDTNGRAGDVSIRSGRVVVGGTVTSAATGPGDAGKVTIAAASGLVLLDGAAVSTQSARSNGGDIALSSGGGVDLYGGRVSATAKGDGGGITLAAPGTLQLAGGEVSTEAGGNGGNITLVPGVAALNRARISANARNNGGNIRITPSALLSTPDTRITATGTSGVSGQILLTTPDQSVTGALASLSASLYHAELTLRPSCGLRAGGESSSFIVTGRGGQAPEPGGWEPDWELTLTPAGGGKAGGP